MLKEIMEMASHDDFMNVSRIMVDRRNRTKLCSEMKSSGIFTTMEDCWTPEHLHSYYCKADGVLLGLEETARESNSAKLIHRLQLIGAFNPGLNQVLRKFIERACV